MAYIVTLTQSADAGVNHKSLPQQQNFNDAALLLSGCSVVGIFSSRDPLRNGFEKIYSESGFSLLIALCLWSA